ncbi:VAMP5 protein, partial [Pitta sordida]|nr:VAMP5 protein [Pitta sordida]
PHGPRVPLVWMSPRSPCPLSLDVPTLPVSHGPRVPPAPVSRLPRGYPHPRCPPLPCPQAGLARCQREAEEVTELMRQNVARALEREGHLEQLESRAQDLRHASQAFRRSSRRVKQQQRQKHRRWHLVALGLGLVLLLLLGLALALALGLARAPPATVIVTVPTPEGQTEPHRDPPTTEGPP